jgi:acetyl esterase/lipase
VYFQLPLHKGTGCAPELIHIINADRNERKRQSRMNDSLIYVHNKPASFKSQFLQSLMSVAGMKSRTKRNLENETFSSEAAALPRWLRDGFTLMTTEINGRKIQTFYPRQKASQKLILYIHGGAYISSLTKYDWNLVGDLLLKTGATIVVPDYPLAPVATCKEVYQFFDILYSRMIATVPREIIFLGNSAGGGLALGLAQKLRNEGKPQPSQLILISPWLDITMSNPDIIKVDKRDKLLGIKGLLMAGQAYAGTVDPRDFRISPIYGDFSGLGKISIFIGTHDLFIADTRKLKDMLDTANIPFNYFEYPKMFHVWVAVTNLNESRHAIEQITTLINPDKDENK